MKKITGFIIASVVAVIINGLFFVPVGLFAKETAPAFPDVPKEHPFAQTIETLKQKGFIKGYPDGTFSPDTTVSRAEFITIIMASTGENLSGANCFKDVKDEWFAKFVCAAKKKGFISGYKDGNFKPANNINLAEASAVLAKAYKLSPSKLAKGEPWYKPAIKKLEAKKAIPVSIDYLDKKISRAETGEMILRLKGKIETKPTKSFTALASEVPQIESCAELKEKFNIGYYKQNLNRGIEKMALFEMALPAPPSGVPTSGAVPSATTSESADSASSPSESVSPESSSDYSSTNVQVEGVDESDVIKNDGEFIYMVSANVVRVIKAFPPEKMNEIAKVEMSDKNFQPSEIYVSDNKLVILGSTYVMNEAKGYSASRAKVYIFDISDKAAIKEIRNIELDGWTISSRKIGNRLYLVVNKTPNFYGVLEKEIDTLELLPHFRDSVKGKEELVSSCGGIRFIPQYDQPNFLTVASINIDDENEPMKRETIMGAGDTIYASTGSLYVASRRYEYPVMGTFKIWGGPVWNYDQKTALFRFNLENGDVKFATKGEVKGTLLNQFSMDESGEAFRIATTIGEVWNQQTPSKNNLFILDKNDLSKMLGSIEGIAPGEKIYSVRFLGSRAYMVTFKKIDPFFVIDVSEPTAPKILGELKIPGFSDYLHP
ncbi:MAG: beta-propeller domain-containing protein, partial [Patescibacteria group bacterium]